MVTFGTWLGDGEWLGHVTSCCISGSTAHLPLFQVGSISGSDDSDDEDEASRGTRSRGPLVTFATGPPMGLTAAGGTAAVSTRGPGAPGGSSGGPSPGGPTPPPIVNYCVWQCILPRSAAAAAQHGEALAQLRQLRVQGCRWGQGLGWEDAVILSDRLIDGWMRRLPARLTN